MNSIRSRLLLILLVTTGVVWLCAAAWIYFSTQAHVEQVLDARLREAARMVNSLLADRRIALNSIADAVTDVQVETVPGAAYSKQLSCQIWSLSGSLVGQSQGAPQERLSRASEGYSYTVINNETWRVFSVSNQERGVQVMVGDNLQVRQSLVNDVMLGTLLPMALVLPLGALMIWFSVRRGIKPLDNMAHALSAREASDLGPIGSGAEPSELRPVLGAINGLFKRVELAREHEKTFTAFAAHELKTPLAGLKAQAQIALATEDNATRAHALTQIASSVDRSARMVRQLLDLAEVDAKDDRFSLRASSIDKVVEGALLAVDVLRAKQDIAVLVTGERDGDIVCELQLATTALRNVLENAVLQSPAGGDVRLSIERDGSFVRFSVADSGPGMTEEELSHARDRFFRGRDQRSSGTGLGLAIVDTVLRRVGGTFAIVNREGGGLVVTLSFPKA